jgi:hypothetical protein
VTFNENRIDFLVLAAVYIQSISIKKVKLDAQARQHNPEGVSLCVRSLT